MTPGKFIQHGNGSGSANGKIAGARRIRHSWPISIKMCRGVFAKFLNYHGN
jgi:hypothetical protein